MVTKREAPATLQSGFHETAEKGMCLMEAVAWVAGLPHSDAPECTSPVLATFAQTWNDSLRSDEERAQLLPYIPMLIGTAGAPEADMRRSWMALDWLVRVHTPAWLDLAGLGDHATALRDLPEIVDDLTLQQGAAARDAARDAARAAAWAAARDAAWDAARAAARDAAWAAAWAAARDAARAAAWAAAWAAARDAAWWAAAWAAARAAAWAAAWAAARDAAWAAAWAAARDAARDAARATAWDAARDAAWAAARDAARDAARAAAVEKLEPTVKELQASAHDLFNRMIAA